MYVLSLDIGTSSLKGAVISHEGKLVSEGRVYYGKSVVWPHALRELLGKLDHAFFIDAVAISGNGPTLIPLKNDNSFGAPLYWYEEKKQSPAWGQSLYLPKLVWLKENRSEEYINTKTFLNMDGFFNYLLTGECSAPIFDDRFIPFFWSRDTAEKNNLDFEKLPDLIQTGEKIGNVTKVAEDKFGIRKGTPVFAGGSDFLMAILGTATLEPGQVCDRAGTSEGINVCREGNPFISNSELRIMPHITPGCTNISARLMDSGNLIEHDEKTFAKSFCHMLHALEKEGCLVDALRMSGGQARDERKNQLRANCTGKKVLVPEIADGELLGCACAAFAGMGLFESPACAAENLVHISREYIPE